MDRSSFASEARFEAYLEAPIEVVGHAVRAEPMRDCGTGLLLPMERNSVEPMAAATTPLANWALLRSVDHALNHQSRGDVAIPSWPERSSVRWLLVGLCIQNRGNTHGASASTISRA
jgi:SRSO17 transposase